MNIFHLIKKNKYPIIIVITITTFLLSTFVLAINYVLFGPPGKYKYIVAIISFLGAGILEYINTISLGKMLYGVRKARFEELFAKYNGVSNEFFLTKGTLGISTLIDINIKSTVMFMQDIVTQIIPAFLYIIYVIITMIYSNVYFGSITSLWLIIAIFGGLWLQKLGDEHNGKLYRTEIDQMAYVQDSIDNNAINRIFSIDNTEKLKEINIKNSINYSYAWNFRGLFEITYKAFALLLFMITIYYCENMENPIFFYSNVSLLYWVIFFRLRFFSLIQMNYSQINETELAMEELNNYKKPPSAPKDFSIEFQPNITIKNLKYKNILDLPELSIKPGDRWLIKGESGCGKTTLINILTKQINSFTGEIIISGKNINNWNDELFFENVGYITQTHCLYRESVKYNLQLAGKNISKNEMLEVLNKVNLNVTLDTMIIGLSVGQKQRLNIARTLLRKPKLLFCDEITSSLDLENRHLIRNIIFNEFKDCTIVMTDHNSEELKPYITNILLLENIKNNIIYNQ